MEKFLALPEEKRKGIIDAGLSTFGRVGYKKASVNDIATAAGISKAMIFHYFGSKKQMYLYLMQYACDRIIEAFTSEMLPKTQTDFFDRILVGMMIKLQVLKAHPSFLQFLMSVYYETDPEVAQEIADFLKYSERFRGELTLTDIDREKFKPGVEPELVLKILVKCAEGYVSTPQVPTTLDVEQLVEEFRAIIKVMRNNFYKEAYLG